MFEVLKSSDAETVQVIEIRSNLSMSLDRLAVVFLGISAVTLLAALLPLILGLWPVMVIAVLHLAIVGWCLRLSWRGNWARERLTIRADDLIIEHYDLRRRTRSSWQVAWTRIQLEKAASGEVQLFVSCQGRREQIAAFLPDKEKLALAEVLKESLRPLSAWRAANQPQVS